MREYYSLDREKGMYTGETNICNLMYHAHGDIKQNNGFEYDGEWGDNKIHGKGIFQSQDGA